MPYKINPFTGNPDYYDASTGGTVTSITAGTGLSPITITTSGTIDIDITKVPYYSGGPLVSGFTKWNGTTWVIDTNNYVNKAGDTMTGFLTLNTDPTSNLHAATKQYVDNVVAAGINFHAPVVAATAAPLPSVTYSNGTGGVGATLIATANGALTIDTIPFLGGGTERVLIKDQVSGLENGIYVVNVAGDALTPFQLTRATDADNSPSGELAFGDFCFVQQGPTNGNFGYILNTTGPITVGTTALSYVIFNAAQVVTAGTGLTEVPTNTLNIDTTKVPYYGSGFSPGFAKWDGINWIFDNSTYLDTITAASTYLTLATAASTYYLQTNPAGYITTAALSGYVPYTGATNNVNLGAFQLTTSQLNIDAKGTISSSGTNTLLVNNTAADGTTKVQFNGVDSLILKGATTSNAASLTYTKPTRTGLTGENVKSIQITTGTSEWTDWANFPGVLQKEIEITSPYYTVTALPPPPPGPSGDFYTLYINAPTVDTWGVYGNALGLYGSFQMKGDATDYPGGTILDIGSDGDGTIIGLTGAKLSFFGNPPIVQPSGITTVQGLSTALSNLGLISPSTLSFGTTGSVLFAGVSGALSQDNANFFWDDTNNRLGIGTSTPTERLNVSGGNFLLTMALGGYLKMYDQAGIIHNIESNQALVLQTTTSYINLKAGSGGSISFATNNSSTPLLTLNSSNVVGNTTNQFLFNSYTQSGLLASTEVNTSVWNGATKTWQTGAITTQREHYIKSSTLNFATASTITNAYSLFVESPTAGATATITNNYAAGFLGNVLVRDTLSPTFPALLNADLEVHKVKNSDVIAIVRNDWQGASNSATATVMARTNSSTQIKMSITSTTYLTTGLITPGRASILTAGSSQDGMLIGNQTSSKDIIFVNGGTAAANEIFRISSSNTIDIYDGRNITFSTSTGTKIGTATTQKLGFFNATPIVQPGPVTDAQGIANALTSLGLLAASTIVASAPSVQSVVSAATVTPVAGNDAVVITAQAVPLTLANPTGAWSDAQSLMIRIKDNGTVRTIGYGASYRAVGITLPTSTVATKTIYLGIMYNSNSSTWDVVGVSIQA